jgi:adenosylhomocysteine nucleosidase
MSDLPQAIHSPREPRVAIIAAMPVELKELARTWPRQSVAAGTATAQIWWSNTAVAACAGMGPQQAIRALAAVRSVADVRAVVSIGFAGALQEASVPGDVFLPSMVIDSNTGERIRTAAGDGSTLVTIARMADAEEKQRLAETYGAHCCDMEAAGLARHCVAAGLPFYALKAISDDIDFSLPALEKFTTRDGQFRTAAFVAHVLLRPALWHKLVQLQRGSAAASHALAAAVAGWMPAAQGHLS